MMESLDDVSEGGSPPRRQVAILGAGFSGIGAAMRLRAAGIDDFVILERASEIGGAWRDNTYPGCECDIPSVLYSFSFAPNPWWSKTFSEQPEILGYLRRCVEESDLTDRLVLDAEVWSATWDEGRSTWQVETSRGRYEARFLFVACGPLSDPAVPALPGIESFAGARFHSARWADDIDWAQSRVAVIGTGSSAAQIVPWLAARAAQVTVFQRSAHWLLPKRNRPTGRLRRLVLSRSRLGRRSARALAYWSREIPALAITRRPRLLAAVRAQALRQLHAQVPDPELRRKLTPRYEIFCKRVVMSSDYYPALTLPHVDLVTEPISRVDERSLVTADGATHAADVIVYATGFRILDPPIAERVHGRSGESLAQTWRADGRAAYLGTSVAGFPNMFLSVGPNSAIGHTSLLVMIEAQIDHLVDCLRVARETGIDVVEVRREAQDRFAADVQRRMGDTVWQADCGSYYFDSTGVNTTLWPNLSWSFRRRTRTFDLDSYHVIKHAEAPAASALEGRT